MGKVISPYYPRRATWYSPLLAVGGRVRHRLALDRLCGVGGVSFPAFFASLLIPGLGFYLRSPRRWGWAGLGAAALLMLIGVVWLGQTASNLAFGLLLSLHVSGVNYLCTPWLALERFRTRVAFSLVLLFALVAALYLPARNLVEHHWLTPLQVNGKVIIVHKQKSMKEFRRGDWIAYSFPTTYGHGMYIRGGVGLGPLLGLPGDRVGFTDSALLVNGVAQPRRLHMPGSGEWTLSKTSWFVWPELSISGHGNVSEATISSGVLQLAEVREEQVLGKPFQRWFWRKQM